MPVAFIFLALILGSWQTLQAQPSFYAFESGHVRPLALSPDGTRLYAVNTPDNRLDVFAVSPDGLTHLEAVPVGMEPVAVAAPHPDHVWVVNHLSDSVSIVDVSHPPFRVVRTLLVGDEPNDIVFAGTARQRAFITTAHRGQNGPHPQGHYDQPGVGRADVYVFDVHRAQTVADTAPDSVLTLFGDKPRALAVSPDDRQVYAAIFHSGNQTTTVNDAVVCDGGAQAAPCTVVGVVYPGGLPAPNTNHEGQRAPETGLIVKFNGSQWTDELGRDWSNAVRFNLPDLDVFTVDANTLETVASASGVGTILFNMAVNPQTGALYVSNTEARNDVRFEGPGVHASEAKPSHVPPTVRGRLHEARITVIEGTTVLPRHLNKHIPYGASPIPEDVQARSLATPLGMAVSSDGSTLYVAAFGSAKIAVFSTASLADDSFQPDAATHISLAGGGPTGLLLDETHHRLYVLTRFDNAVASIDLATRTELQRLPLYNPEPPSIVDGRPFLYDATLTSSNGEASCSSCHVFGDMDDLAWDLGDPDGNVQPNPNPFITGDHLPFHPMKGPMTTQSLRGLAHHGPMHWRGDRTGGHDDPPGDPLDEAAAFKAFNMAFDGLLGRDAGELTDEEMQAFTDFVLQLTYPPNPIRQLDNVLRPDEAEGQRFFFLDPGPDLTASCEGCHRLDPASGFFGSGGESTTEGEPQEFKVPHLRNSYQKVGLFGMPDTPFLPGNPTHRGDQIRGFGFLHDGGVDTIAHFLNAIVFVGFRIFPELASDPDLARRQLAAYLMAFDTSLAPIVGQQITLTAEPTAAATARIALMEARANTHVTMVGAPMAMECEVIVKGVVNGEARGWVRLQSGVYRSDRLSEPELSSAALQALAAAVEQALTYTCAPPGAGVRMGVDRDEDGVFDRDEIDAGTDPAKAATRDPQSVAIRKSR